VEKLYTTRLGNKALTTLAFVPISCGFQKQINYITKNVIPVHFRNDGVKNIIKTLYVLPAAALTVFAYHSGFVNEARILVTLHSQQIVFSNG